MFAIKRYLWNQEGAFSLFISGGGDRDLVTSRGHSAQSFESDLVDYIAKLRFFTALVYVLPWCH